MARLGQHVACDIHTPRDALIRLYDGDEWKYAEWLLRTSIDCRSDASTLKGAGKWDLLAYARSPHPQQGRLSMKTSY